MCVLAEKDGCGSSLPAKIKALDLPLESKLSTVDRQLAIGWHNNKLSLFPQKSGPILIDFVTGRAAHRRQYGGGKKQPLARAIGLTSKITPTVIDATAGFGRDSFVLASLGCEVRMVERSVVIAALLEDALKRAGEEVELLPIIERLSITCSEATTFLQKKERADTVYLDPMYPERKKSAAVKKEMQALQMLVGSDMDSEELLDVALQRAKHRVVVKRPRNADLVGMREPDTRIFSPNTRYDIYTLKSF